MSNTNVPEMSHVTTSQPSTVADQQGDVSSASLALPQGMGLPTMPIMLSVSLPDKDKGSLPPVLQLIKQSGLQTLSHLLPQPSLSVPENSQTTPVLDYNTAGTAIPDVTQKHPLLARSAFDLSSILKMPNSNDIVSAPSQMSLADTASVNGLASTVLETSSSQGLSSQNLVNSSGTENVHKQAEIDPAATLSAPHGPTLHNLSVQDAIAVHLCNGEFNRSDLGPQLEALVSNSTYIQQPGGQEAPDLVTGQYTRSENPALVSQSQSDTSDNQLAVNPLMSVISQCQLNQHLQNPNLQSEIQDNHMMSTASVSSHQPENSHLSGQPPDTTQVVNGQLAQTHQQDSVVSHQKNDVAIGNEMTVVGYSSQDYLNMQTNLAAYLPVTEDQTNQDSAVVAANLNSQIEAITNAMNNHTGEGNNEGKQLPTSSANCNQLLDMVLKLAGKRDLMSTPSLSTQTSSVQDSSGQQTVSVVSNPAVSTGVSVPKVFISYCVECNSGAGAEPCQYHNLEQKHILDSPILTVACASLPSCLYLQDSEASKSKAAIGVWAKETIAAKIKFGPLLGKVNTHPPGQYKIECLPEFQVIYYDKVEVYELVDEQLCNWLMFVRMARSAERQNLVATQLGTQIFFYTTREIYPGEELLFWYSKDYAMFLGVPATPDTKKLKDCFICGKIFLNRKCLQNHQKLLHTSGMKKKWICNICGQGFSASAKLNDHINIHKGIKPHSCQYCGKRFTDQSNLRTHLDTHSSVKKFHCDECGRQFRQKIHLQTHTLTHTGEKNLQCNYCDKKFARESDRKKHQNEHTKEKIYQCTECSKNFYKLQNYKRHLLVHSGEKNHACFKCQKRFYTKYHLQRHSKTCKGGKTEIYLNKHEKNLNLEEMANELTAGPSASRNSGKS